MHVSRVTPASSAPASPERQLREAVAELQPFRGAINRVQRTMMQRIAPPRALSVWELLQDALVPAETLRTYIWSRITPRLQPVQANVISSWRFKWGVAIAVVVITARVSPLLFLAPPTIAESPVMLLQTRGTVEVLSGALWQPIRGEITLTQTTTVQTQAGEATIILHDDAVFRLAPNTRVTLYDLSDRPERKQGDATLALEEGTLWALGLVPKNIRSLSIVTPQGHVVLHEGSVSVRNGDDVAVDVWDRSASILRRGKYTHLLTGQHVTLKRDGSQVFGTHGFIAFDDEWVSVNLSRDAAHRRDIAQSQQERRAASAGILPGSTLYPVKRFAEAVDVLLTFGEEQKAKKRITQANTRLNEAAALLSDTSEGPAAAVALQEYKDTLLQVASGSGGSAMVRSMLNEEVVEVASATVAAAIPGDRAYPLKQTVLEAIQALPGELPKPDVRAETIIDELAAVKEQAALGDATIAKQKFMGLASSIAAIGSGTSIALSAESQLEVAAVAMQVSAVIDGGMAEAAEEEEQPAPVILLRIPVQPRHAARLLAPRPMTPEQVAAKAQEMRGRVFAFDTKKAQQSALRDQLRTIERNPDRGRILRELLKVLPRNGLAQRVEVEIRALNDAVEEQITASGAAAQ